MLTANSEVVAALRKFNLHSKEFDCVSGPHPCEYVSGKLSENGFLEGLHGWLVQMSEGSLQHPSSVVTPVPLLNPVRVRET